jgi:hypothetical protein
MAKAGFSPVRKFSNKVFNPRRCIRNSAGRQYRVSWFLFSFHEYPLGIPVAPPCLHLWQRRGYRYFNEFSLLSTPVRRFSNKLYIVIQTYFIEIENMFGGTLDSFARRMPGRHSIPKKNKERN